MLKTRTDGDSTTSLGNTATASCLCEHSQVCTFLYLPVLQVEEGPENYLVVVEQPRKDRKENRERKV